MFNTPRRPFVVQSMTTFALSVTTAPTPLSNDQTLLQSYISSIIINVPAAATENVFLGDRTVTAASGIEIVAGTSVNLALNNTRQLYELEFPLRKALEFLKCKVSGAPEIPVVVFDPTQIALIAPTTTQDIRVALFRAAYV